MRGVSPHHVPGLEVEEGEEGLRGLPLRQVLQQLPQQHERHGAGRSIPWGGGGAVPCSSDWLQYVAQSMKTVRREGRKETTPFEAGGRARVAAALK